MASRPAYTAYASSSAGRWSQPHRSHALPARWPGGAAGRIRACSASSACDSPSSRWRPESSLSPCPARSSGLTSLDSRWVSATRWPSGIPNTDHTASTSNGVWVTNRRAGSASTAAPRPAAPGRRG